MTGRLEEQLHEDVRKHVVHAVLDLALDKLKLDERHEGSHEAEGVGDRDHEHRIEEPRKGLR